MATAGYQVSVICPKGSAALASFEIIDGVHIYRHPLPEEGQHFLGYVREYLCALFWEFMLSFRVFFTRGFDVIHACNPPDLIFLIGAFYKALFRKHFIFDQHDIGPELYEAKFARRGFAWKILIWLEWLSFRIADVSIATNESYRKIAIERGRMTPDKVFVVRSGPNPARVREMAPDASWKNQHTYLVAYVGVIGSQEGLDLLVESITYVRDVRKRSDVQFVIVGDGPDLAAIRSLVAARKLDNFVTFTGRVPDAILFTILSTADVCVNPDRPNEMNDKSTMNKIMEYMALGKPIVQFALTEGRFSAQEASLYARCTDTSDFGDKILELLDDPTQRQNMGLFGKARVAKVLSWSNEAPKLLAAYAALPGRR